MIETQDTKQAVDIMVDHMHAMLKEKNYIVLGVVGGTSVNDIFQMLSLDSRVPWDHIHVFLVDERYVPKEDEQSNFSVVKQFLLPVSFPPSQLHPFVLKEAPRKSIANYTRELKKYGGSFDMVILSSGEDGHVGGLYPHYTIKDPSEYFLYFDNSPKPPKERMTASRTLLEQSGLAVLLFIGPAKQEAYERFKDPQLSVYDCPAKIGFSIDTLVVVRR